MLKRFGIGCVVAAAWLLAGGQVAPLLAQGALSLPGSAPAAAPVVVPSPDAPLRRDSPRSTFLNFVSTAQNDNFTLAAEYLQWPRHGMTITKEEAAEQLRFALNHGFEGSVDRMRRDPLGTVSETLTADHEKVGSTVLADGDRVDIIMVRVTPKTVQAIWLFSAETVAEIPRMYEHSGLPELERRLPKSLTDVQFGGLPAWVPIALTVLLVALYFLTRLVRGSVSWVVSRIRRLRRRRGEAGPSHAWKLLSGPSAFILTLALHWTLAAKLGIPLMYRVYHERVSVILLLGGLVWWMWRLGDVVAEGIRDRLRSAYPATAQSAYVLGRRVLKGAAVGLALLIGLAAFGVNLSATLAGLGIGGIAIAFAAQKTLENLFGGMFVLSDRSIMVGDFCRIGQYLGDVEDVGLRTTSLRTLNRTMVHVPNGTMATVELENFSRRDKFLINQTVALHYETTREQLEGVLVGIRKLLDGDARIEKSSSRVRLVKFGSSSLDIEVFAYALVPDYNASLVVQEDLLLGVMDVVQQAGTALAVPSQTTYVKQEAKD